MHLSQIPEAVGADFAIPARPCLFSPSNIPVSVADILSMQGLVPGGASPSDPRLPVGTGPFGVSLWSLFYPSNPVGAWMPHWVLLHPGFCRAVQTVPLASFPIKLCLLPLKSGGPRGQRAAQDLAHPD